MKNKKLSIILIIIIITILIASIGIFTLYKNLKEETKQNERIMNEIKEEYKQFENTLSTYNQNRETFSNYLKDYYQDNLKTDYLKYINLLETQENTINNLTKNINKIETNCKNRLFKEKEINDICNKYQEYYETVVNIYINDYNQVNTMIQSYNKDKNESLNEYQSTDLNDYIDYNKDGKYLEKRD